MFVFLGSHTGELYSLFDSFFRADVFWDIVYVQIAIGDTDSQNNNKRENVRLGLQNCRKFKKWKRNW